MDNKKIVEIQKLAQDGGAEGSGIAEVFSRVYCAVQKTLNITPFAEQIGAGAFRSQNGANADRRGQDPFRGVLSLF